MKNTLTDVNTAEIRAARVRDKDMIAIVVVIEMPDTPRAHAESIAFCQEIREAMPPGLESVTPEPNVPMREMN